MANNSSEKNRARLVGLNHIALEVGDVEEALAFYGKIFDFKLRGKAKGAAFIDMGDQFIALMEGPTNAPKSHRHVGLVVDNRSAVKALAIEAGAQIVDGPFLDFIDPWGNRLEVVEYANVQFAKVPAVLTAMELVLEKNETAKRELAAKGLLPKSTDRKW
jgi:catechol 2,3-dioxygenase-like lactoylglutathione lyase family enzyme